MNYFRAIRRARRIVAMACRRAGVGITTGARVESVASGHVTLAGGIELASRLTVWLTGAAPPPMLAASRLPKSDDGYLAVDDALRAVGGSPVWGAGDCITMRDHAWIPKAGVYAVRQGPVLAHNLRVFLQRNGRSLLYQPQSGFLSLVSTSHARALFVYRDVAIESRCAQMLKRFIDQRFMKRYRPSPLA